MIKIFLSKRFVNSLYCRFTYNNLYRVYLCSVGLLSCRHLSVDKRFVGNISVSVDSKKRLYDCDIVFSGCDVFIYDLFYSKCNVLSNFTRYGIMFRVCYDEGSMYKTLGSQYIFHVKELINRKNGVEEMHSLILARIRESMINYGFSVGDVVSVQLLVSELYYTDILVKPKVFDLSSIPAEYRNISSRKSDMVFNKSVPRSMDLNIYAISFKSVPKDVIDMIKTYNEKSEFLKFSENVVKYMDRRGKSLLSLIEKVDSDNRRVIGGTIFDMRGNRITDYVDTLVSKDLFKRRVGTVTNYINSDGEVVKTSTRIPLSPIRVFSNKKRKYSTFKRTHPGPEYRIGTIDLETYKDVDGITKVYAAGVYTNQYKDKIYYINKDTLNSIDVLYKLYAEVVSSKYHKYTFYIHNAGKFDFGFMLLPVVEHYDKIYKEKLILRDSTILSIKIDKGGKSKIVVEFVDSYNILTNNLSNLCKSYDTVVRKDVFPHKFVTRDRLFYIGLKPNISYYEDEEGDLDRSIYDKIPIQNFDLEKMCKKYLLNDLISLYEVISKFKDKIYDRYKVDLTNCRTITSISMEVFKTSFYDNINTPIP